MVAPNREIANKYNFTPSAMSSLNDTNNVSEDINMDDPRGRSNAVSRNSSRESSVSSRTSSVAYSKRMEIQSDDLNWANQTDIELFKVPFSSQAGGESNNQVPANETPYGPTTYIDLANNMFPNPDYSNLTPLSLSYAELQPADLSSWEGRTQPISIFGRISIQGIDVNNIKTSLTRISEFIANRHIKNNKETDIPCLESFSKIAFELVKSIYKGGWDNLLAGDSSKSFRDKIKEEFTTRVPSAPTNRRSDRFPPTKPVEFTNIPPPLNPTKLPKEGGTKPKLNGKPINDKPTNISPKPARTYTQASSANICDILKLKENFPKLSDKKIEKIHKTVHNSNTLNYG